MTPVVGQNVQYNSHFDKDDKMVVRAAIIVDVHEGMPGSPMVNLVIFGRIIDRPEHRYNVRMGTDPHTWKYLPTSAYFPMTFGVVTYENKEPK